MQESPDVIANFLNEIRVSVRGKEKLWYFEAELFRIQQTTNFNILL